LSALTSFYLLGENSLIPDLTNLIIPFGTGVEIGRIADYVIAPLISSYIVTQNRVYLDIAVRIGDRLLESYNGSLFSPFFGTNMGQFGTREVFIESISSVYPALAALAFHTHEKRFSKPIKKFLAVLKGSITKNQLPTKYSLKNGKGIHSAVLDIPFRLYSDISRIQRILPELPTADLLKLVLAFLPEANPLKVTFRPTELQEVFTYSVQPCSVGAYIARSHPIYDPLVKKCENLVKRNSIPSRLNGASEFGAYDLETGFAFEGELFEFFWRNGGQDRIEPFITKSLKDCRFGEAVTGLVNATFDGRQSDNWMHPELFSRWIFNGLLVAAGVQFEDVTLSEGGHLLMLKPGTKIVI
jgi:hypothetical protein